jgi:hypothetical protein
VENLRTYWLAALLGALGVALLAVGRLITRETASAAGLLLLGAAVTRLIDIYQHRQTSLIQEVEQQRRGLDETRRLLLMIRMSTGEPSPELVASVVNALLHHHAVATSTDELMFRLMRSGRGASEENKLWMQGLIDEITRKRDALR